MEKPSSNFDAILISELHHVPLDILLSAEDILPLACSLEIVGMRRAFLCIEVGDTSIDGVNHCLVLGMREVPRQAQSRDHGLDSFRAMFE